jgi:hypothetical protein
MMEDSQMLYILYVATVKLWSDGWLFLTCHVRPLGSSY